MGFTLPSLRKARYTTILSISTGRNSRSSELVTEYRYDPDVPYFNILVPTGDTVRYKYLINKLLQSRKNILVSGETGVGKSVIVADFLGQMELDKFSYTVMNFSAQTSTKNLLDVYLDKDKFTKKRRTEIGPLGGKRMVFFVDDINMPALEKYGAQPPNELLRQIIDQGGFYDLKKFLFMEVSDCVFIACCAPTGGGRNKVTPRLFRHFNMVWAPDLSVKSMDIIFTSILKGFLSLSKGLEKFAPSIVKSSL
jgi:dynein heavy chain